MPEMAALLPIARPGALGRSQVNAEGDARSLMALTQGHCLCRRQATACPGYRLVFLLKVTVHGRPSTRDPEPDCTVNLLVTW